MKLRIGTNCFYYWKIGYQEIIDRFSHLVDGFEFVFGNNYDEFKDLSLPRNLRYNSIHLSWCFDRFDDFNLLRKVISKVNAMHVIIHPEHYNSFSHVPDDISFLLENMDLRKGSFTKVDEVLSLVRKHKNFGLNFDICHYEEIEKGLTDKQINNFIDKIKALHISVPEGKFFGVKTPHYLCYNSSFTLPSNLPRNVPWTIEGVIPKDDSFSVEKEVEFLRDY